MPIDDAVAQLNFHHLRYFWLVASEGSLSATARRLRVAQSAVSSQIHKLEDHLGEPLFQREGRSLVLTETGRIVHAYADDIFGMGSQLLALLRSGRSRTDLLRIGAVATLSRNFQTSFLEPLFATPDARFRLVSAPFDGLVDRLGAHDLDLVLSNRPVPAGHEASFHCQLVARQQVSLIGHPRATPLRFPEDLAEVPLLLPPAESGIRTSFDALCSRHGVEVRPVAEVDDMALLRLLARDTELVALLPSVVVRDELSAGTLQEHVVLPDLVEPFYAITADRRFQHPLLEPLLTREPGEILAMGRG
jgi:LysR family transcriptional activator of nhaA